MHTYIDFLTRIKGVEYILAVLTITGFILYLEILKPAPFKTLVDSARDDLEFMRKSGYRDAFRTARRVLAAPFIGLFYVIMLPFVFTYAVGTELLRIASDGLERALGLAGKTAFFGWRPMEAYFGGKKKKEKKEHREPEERKEQEEK